MQAAVFPESAPKLIFNDKRDAEATASGKMRLVAEMRLSFALVEFGFAAENSDTASQAKKRI